MMRALGLAAFAAGFVALVAMLAVDVLGFAQVPTPLFASLAMVLTAAMWTVPALRMLGKEASRG